MNPSASTERERLELRARVAELERQAEDRRTRKQELDERFRHLTAVTNEAVAIVDQGLFFDCSPEFEALYGYSRDELIGRSPVMLVAPESREIVAHKIQTGSEGRYEAYGLRRDGSKFLLQVRAKALSYERRTLRVAVNIDITERRRAEEARKMASVQQELIRAQAEMIARLSTPLLPISDRVVVLPLVGEVNAARAAQIIETLTHGVFAHRAAVAIIDITGIRTVDAAVADLLIRAAEAVQLLGAKAIVTGVRPEVAQAIGELGKDLGRIVVLGTLQDGVSRALAVATA